MWASVWEEGRYALTSGGAPGDATLRGKREGVRTITHPKEKPQLNVSPEQRKDPSLPILDRAGGKGLFSCFCAGLG